MMDSTAAAGGGAGAPRPPAARHHHHSLCPAPPSISSGAIVGAPHAAPCLRARAAAADSRCAAAAAAGDGGRPPAPPLPCGRSSSATQSHRQALAVTEARAGPWGSRDRAARSELMLSCCCPAPLHLTAAPAAAPPTAPPARPARAAAAAAVLRRRGAGRAVPPRRRRPRAPPTLQKRRRQLQPEPLPCGPHLLRAPRPCTSAPGRTCGSPPGRPRATRRGPVGCPLHRRPAPPRRLPARRAGPGRGRQGGWRRRAGRGCKGARRLAGVSRRACRPRRFLVVRWSVAAHARQHPQSTRVRNAATAMGPARVSPAGARGRASVAAPVSSLEKERGRGVGLEGRRPLPAPREAAKLETLSLSVVPVCGLQCPQRQPAHSSTTRMCCGPGRVTARVARQWRARSAVAAAVRDSDARQRTQTQTHLVALEEEEPDSLREGHRLLWLPPRVRRVNRVLPPSLHAQLRARGERLRGGQGRAPARGRQRRGVGQAAGPRSTVAGPAHVPVRRRERRARVEARRGEQRAPGLLRRRELFDGPQHLLLVPAPRKKMGQKARRTGDQDGGAGQAARPAPRRAEQGRAGRLTARRARLSAIATPCRVWVKWGSRYSSMLRSNCGALRR